MPVTALELNRFCHTTASVHCGMMYGKMKMELRYFLHARSVRVIRNANSSAVEDGHHAGADGQQHRVEQRRPQVRLGHAAGEEVDVVDEWYSRTACPVRWASMVPAWILKVSSTMATIGATVVKVSTMPSSSRMTLCGLEKKVLTLLSTMVDLLARRVVGWFMASSSFLRFAGRWRARSYRSCQLRLRTQKAPMLLLLTKAPLDASKAPRSVSTVTPGTG